MSGGFLSLLHAGAMGYWAAEATLFFFINPCVLSTNRVDFGLFLFHQFFSLTSLPRNIKRSGGFPSAGGPLLSPGPETA